MPEPLNIDQKATFEYFEQILELLHAGRIIENLESAAALSYIVMETLQSLLGREKAVKAGHELVDLWVKAKINTAVEGNISSFMEELLKKSTNES